MLTRFVVTGVPVGKPRMTKRDKWKQRPCVLRYREWCDAVRRAAEVREPVQLRATRQMHVVAYLPIPASWSRVNRLAMAGKPHGAKPDADNVLKGVCDALFANDELVWSSAIQKRWADDGGPRLEVEIL